jgi:hypothetical protein
MEPAMIKLKVLSTAAAIALLLPMLAPATSFAQGPKGGGAARSGARGPAVGGGFRGPAGGSGPRYGGGGGYRGGYGVGAGVVAGAVIGGAIASQGYYGPGYYAPGYYAPGYYDDSGYDDGGVAVAPAPAGGDAVAYCMQRFRSYDPASGSYLGNDGQRHPCP